MIVTLTGDKWWALSGVFGYYRPDFVTTDYAGVIIESNNTVYGIFKDSWFNNPEKVIRYFLPVDDQFAFEEPVAGMLAVVIAQHEQLHIGGVPA